MLSYWFYPNPGNTSYGSTKVLLLLGVCTVLLLASFFVSSWRCRQENPVTRKLSRMWPGALRSFGGIGLLLVVSRVEEIQFLAMRFFWALWVLAAAGFLAVQVWWFRKRHYTVLRRERAEDPREKYLPKRG